MWHFSYVIQKHGPLFYTENVKQTLSYNYWETVKRQVWNHFGGPWWLLCPLRHKLLTVTIIRAAVSTDPV